MKPTLLLVILYIVIAGCNSIPQTKQKVIDNRPKPLLKLITKLDEADSIRLMQNNAIGKKEAIDSGRSTLISFIKSDLNYKIENWPAIVKEITVSEWPVKMIEVTVFVPEKKDFTKKDTAYVYNAITLTSSIDYGDIKLRNLLKGYRAYDKVLVSGTFTKDIIGDIDFTGAELEDDNLFSNPVFKIDLMDLKKAGRL